MLALDTLVWRHGGDLWLTVIAKASFSFARGDGPMELVTPTAIARAEQHHRGNFAASIRASSDLAPHRHACDVLLVGHAVAPGAEPAAEVATRLALEREGRTLLDKRIVVLGDRAAAGAPPKPFARLPLVFERAVGGPGFKENPLGSPVPNAVFADPARAREPAAYGPVSATWPVRKRGAPPNATKVFDQPIAELAGFEPDYWQAAPPDQRVAELLGYEIVVLEGLHATWPRITASLPSARAVTRATLGDEPVGEMHMRADTLFVDADAERCDLVWRASVHVPSEDVLPWLAVEACLEVGDQRLEFERAPIRLGAPRPNQPDLSTLQGTLVMEGQGPVDRSSTLAFVQPGAESLPFAPTTPRSRTPLAERGTPGAPWSRESVPPAPRADGLHTTVALEPEAEPPPASPAPSPPPVFKAPLLAAEPAAPEPPKAEPPKAEPPRVVAAPAAAPPPEPPPAPREPPKPAPKPAPPPKEPPRAAPAVKDLYRKLKGDG